MTTPNQPSPSRQARRLFSHFQIAALFLLALCAILLFIDWETGTQLSRPWLQVGFACFGLLIVSGALFLPNLSRARRCVIAIAGVLTLLAVLDSLDGQQDIFTNTVVILLLWATIFGDVSLQLLQSTAFTTRRKIAATIAVSSTLLYMGSACYYVFLNRTIGPQNADHNDLYGIALSLNILIRWIGDLAPYSSTLTGTVRVCQTCGLRNIPERQTCKRCGSHLGEKEYITEESPL